MYTKLEEITIYTLIQKFAMLNQFPTLLLAYVTTVVILSTKRGRFDRSVIFMAACVFLKKEKNIYGFFFCLQTSCKMLMRDVIQLYVLYAREF